MTQALALNNAVEYGQSLGLYQTPGENLTHYWPDPNYYGPTYYPWVPTVYPLTITNVTVVTGTAHRVCACPKCDGSCCDCADCKVKRLEQRVAELEGTT